MSDHRPITPEKKQALKKRFSKFNKYSSGHHDVRDEADPEMQRLYIFLDRWQRIEKFRNEVRDIEQRIPGARFDFDSGGRSIFRSEYMTEDQARLHFEMAAEAKERRDRKQSDRYGRQKRRKYERKLEQSRREMEEIERRAKLSPEEREAERRAEFLAYMERLKAIEEKQSGPQKSRQQRRRERVYHSNGN